MVGFDEYISTHPTLLQEQVPGVGASKKLTFFGDLLGAGDVAAAVFVFILAGVAFKFESVR